MKEKIIDHLKNNTWWHIALLILLPLAVYIQSVHFDYTNFDDNKIIKDKFETVGHLANLRTAIHEDAFFNRRGDFYRPVQNISFMLDAQVSGNKLWMFHITNLLIHILACIALYFFLQLLLLKRFTAFLVTLLFAVHPLFASCVGWVPARGDILIGLEGLLLFISFHYYFTTNKQSWFIINALVFFVMIFTKETAVLFPLLLLFYYFMVLPIPDGFKNVRTAFKKLFPFFLLWIIVAALFYLMRRRVIRLHSPNSITGFSSFFKNIAVIPTFIGKFFIPDNLSTLPLYDAASIIIGLLLLAWIVYVVLKYSIAKKWIALMGLLWYLCFTIPPAFYRLKNADSFFNYLEHRSYLPLMGIVIILGCLLNDHLTKKLFTQYFIRLYIPVILLFAILAAMHCADYKNAFALENNAAELNNPMALAARADKLLSDGDTSKAFSDLDKAVQLASTNGTIYFMRGKAKQKTNDTIGACNDWTKAAALGYKDTTGMLKKFCSSSYKK